MSLSLFNMIGGMKLKSCEVRIWLVDGSLKNVEGFNSIANNDIICLTHMYKCVVWNTSMLEKHK